MTGLIELLIASGSLPPSLLVLRAGSARALHADPVIYELRFPSSLRSEDVERFLVSLTALLPPWWKRIVVQPVVVFELVATADQIRHHLIMPTAVRGYIDGALQAHVPGMRYQTIEPERWLPQSAAEYRTTTDARPLRVDAEALATGLLTAVQPLRGQERVIIQWLFTAGWPTGPARLAKPQDSQFLPSAELLSNTEAVTARRSKLRAPLLLAVGRIGASAGSERRAIQLVRQVEGPMHATRAPGVHFARRMLPPNVVAKRISNRQIPITKFPAILNVEEAVGVVSWPIGGRVPPGMTLGGCQLLPVPRALPSAGTVLGTATFPAELDRPVAVDLEARYRHVAITGPTGTGKTTLATQIAIQDLQAKRGLVVIDPKGELVSSIAERLPQDRVAEVIVLDASRGGPVVGYNPLRTSGMDPELVAEQVLGVMRNIWRANWGPRTDALLRACLFTLVAVGGMTICEIPALLTDEAFRKRLTRKISDPFGVEAAWAQYDSWSDGEQVAASAPLLTKVQALSTRPRLRGVLGQVEGAVDFNRIIRERQILLVNLAAGSLGTEAAYLLGALLFSGLWNAISARGHLPAERRAPVMAVIDEFQNVVALPTPTETILAEARSYHLGLVVAHQHLGQLDNDLQHAVLANARTKVVFQTSQDDARVFARELGGGLTPNDLMGIPAYEAVVSAFASGQVQQPTTILTLPLPPKLRDGDEVRRASQERFGVARDAVDAGLVERQHGHREPSSKVGRARRTES